MDEELRQMLRDIDQQSISFWKRHVDTLSRTPVLVLYSDKNDLEAYMKVVPPPFTRKCRAIIYHRPTRLKDPRREERMKAMEEYCVGRGYPVVGKIEEDAPLDWEEADKVRLTMGQEAFRRFIRAHVGMPKYLAAVDAILNEGQADILVAYAPNQVQHSKQILPYFLGHMPPTVFVRPWDDDDEDVQRAEKAVEEDKPEPEE